MTRVMTALMVAASMLPIAAEAVTFAPELGDERQYYIGLRVEAEASGHRGDEVFIDNVVRYRVARKDASGLSLDIEPRLLTVRVGWHNVVFDSARSDQREPSITKAMASGFELTLPEEGDVTLTPKNEQAWETLAADAPGLVAGQLERNVTLPGLRTPLPPEVGATVTVEGFQSLPDMALEVIDVTDETITADIHLPEQAAPMRVPLGDRQGEVEMTLYQLNGRMRVNREAGWIESLVIFAEQIGRHEGRTVPIQLTLAMQALPENAATGYHPIDAEIFDLFSDSSGNEDVSPDGYPLVLPQSQEDIIDAYDPAASDIDTVFEGMSQGHFDIDEVENTLTLAIPFHYEEGVIKGQLYVNALTLTDARGEALNWPFIATRRGEKREDDGSMVMAITLRPLGWNDVKWSAIEQVSATLAYRPLIVEEHVALELADEPREIIRPEASVRSAPLEGRPGEWRVDMEGAQGFFYVDGSRVYQDIEAFDTDHLYDEPLSPTARTLLNRVAQPLAWNMQWRLQGDAERFPLLYLRYADELDYLDMTFSRKASAPGGS